MLPIIPSQTVENAEKLTEIGKKEKNTEKFTEKEKDTETFTEKERKIQQNVEKRTTLKNVQQNKNKRKIQKNVQKNILTNLQTKNSLDFSGLFLGPEKNREN